MNTWISVEERLPDNEGTYIIYAPTLNEDKPLIYIAWFSGASWELLPRVFADAVTHWMLLPAPPTKEDN